MFRVIALIFAMHGGVVEPYGILGSKDHIFDTQEKCDAFLTSKDGKKFKRHVEAALSEAKSAKLKAKFTCHKDAEEEKSEDDGSI